MLQVQDRGTKKWVSLMLPEHMEMLKNVFIERKARPILDEQKMEKIDETLKYAFTNKLNVGITYYRAGNYLRVIGKLARIDQWQGYIVLLNENGSQISLKDVVNVEIL